MIMPTADAMIAFSSGLPGRFMNRARFVLKIVPIPMSIMIIPTMIRMMFIGVISNFLLKFYRSSIGKDFSCCTHN